MMGNAYYYCVLIAVAMSAAPWCFFKKLAWAGGSEGEKRSGWCGSLVFLET